MSRRFARGVVGLVISLLFGAFMVAGSATAQVVTAPQRLDIPKLGVSARIVPVPVVGGKLMIGHEVRGIVYTPRGGDPLCDPLGTTIIAGHTYRSGDGVADKWQSLKRGDKLRAGGCQFVVEKTLIKSGSTRIGHLMRYDGPPGLVLIGCKPDDYSRRIMVFARKVGR